MLGFRKRRAKTFSSSAIPPKPVLAREAATCRSCGRTVIETGLRTNFRFVSRDAETGQRWIHACPTCRLRRT